MMAGPDSWDDYIAIGKWLIYKKLVVAIIITLFAVLAIAVAIPSFGQKNKAVWEDIIVNDDGLVVTVDKNTERAFTGLGRVTIWNDLQFEGIFKNGRFPSSGKILNSQNELLYEGAVINGNVNTFALLNRQAVEWRTAIKENPQIYLYQNYAGYLFPQLGICGIEVVLEESAPSNSDGAIRFCSLLMDGGQYSPQVQLDYRAADNAEEIQIPFFESFLAVQLRHLRDPEINSNLEVFAVDTGNEIYRVMTASAVLEAGRCILEEDGSAVIWDSDWYIGDIPQVIHYQGEIASPK